MAIPWDPWPDYLASCHKTREPFDLEYKKCVLRELFNPRESFGLEYERYAPRGLVRNLGAIAVWLRGT
ncbi:hypothetical protein ES708_24818 [subsurface metagenome]